MNFHANHMVKLEPGYNAHITITNGQTSTSINPEHPTVEVAGDGFTIKSDKDAMVYFFGKLPSAGVKQVQIENKEKYYVKISNIVDDLIIDFGFGGYLPSTYPIDFRARNNTFYLNYLYNKMKAKLVKDEFLYIYYFSDSNQNLKVEYIQNNLNIKNNDFNIFYMPKNDDNNSVENTIVINAYRYTIIHNIKFCKPNTNIDLYLEGSYKETHSITNETPFSLDLYRGSNKLSFIANQPFVYSYSIYDIIDENIIEKNTDWGNERVVYSDLTINEVKDEASDSNKISITFNPNYKKSSTRYIIIIGLKNDDNTLDNFNDPCYVSRLLNERPEGVIVDQIYDIGVDDTITAIVDISRITEKNQNQEFIVNIISQELRFGKNINFYTPYKFEHTGKEITTDEEEPYDSSSDGQSDSGHSDGGQSDGGHSDGQSDSGHSDGSQSDGGHSDGGHSDGGQSDGGQSDGGHTDPSSGDTKDSGSLEGASLALAIVVPILSIVIIALVVILILKHRRKSSPTSKEEIEKLV